MLVYKMNVLEALKENGYNTSILRKEKLLNESAIQSLRRNEMVGIKSLDSICRLLNKQPGDIVEYVEKWNTWKIV